MAHENTPNDVGLMLVVGANSPALRVLPAEYCITSNRVVCPGLVPRPDPGGGS